MPVWHARTRDWAKANKIQLLGVIQEQHPERCRLFAQWQGFDWPILHDPINVFETSAVPNFIAIDEHGIVRSTRPDPRTFENDFLDVEFADDAPVSTKRIGPKHPPTFKPPIFGNASEQLTHADTLAIWGDHSHLNEAISAYEIAITMAPQDGRAYFRLGVCFRRRYETQQREKNDFNHAVSNWGKALDLDPNQYIWRRRIQQYGPRLDKPYPFYDWVPTAEAEIRKRGQTPIELPVRPEGAEIAQPSRQFVSENANETNPDPQGQILRDKEMAIVVEVVTVPAKVKPGESARVHLTLRPNPKQKAHWNNEAEPLTMWIDAPQDGAIGQSLHSVANAKTATSDEPRRIEFEVQLPQTATQTVKVPAYALYNICDDADGQCRYRRQDLKIVLSVK